jgi:hypothetical protein
MRLIKSHTLCADLVPQDKKLDLGALGVSKAVDRRIF